MNEPTAKPMPPDELPVTSTHSVGDFEFAHRGGSMRRRPGLDEADDAEPNYPDHFIEPEGR